MRKKRMASIHGMVWVIVGIVITTTAFLIEHLSFFKYIGFAFIVFGVLKLLMNFITKPKENKFDKSREQLNNKDNRERSRRAARYCANCGAAGAGNFCRRCGTRL